MSIERQQTWGVIDSLGDPQASIVENYVLRLEIRIEELKGERDALKAHLHRSEWAHDQAAVMVLYEEKVLADEKRIEELERRCRTWEKEVAWRDTRIEELERRLSYYECEADCQGSCGPESGCYLSRRARSDSSGNRYKSGAYGYY